MKKPPESKTTTETVVPGSPHKTISATDDNNNNNSPLGAGGEKQKDLLDLLIFLAAVFSGTICSVTSKILFDMKDDRADGQQQFDKPIAQVLGMFMAMVLGLPFHWLVIACKISFPGYERYANRPRNILLSPKKPTIPPIDVDRTPRMYGASTREERKRLIVPNGDGNYDPNNHLEMEISPKPHYLDDNYYDDDDDQIIPLHTYLYLLIPAAFDCIATVLCMIGLLYMDVSMYQLLRGSGIIFVAMLRQVVLHQHLFRFQWVGVAWNVVSVVLVGCAATLAAAASQQSLENDNGSSTTITTNMRSALIGVVFMLAGTLVQAMMFVFEEKVMTSDEIKVPPLLLFGMEGFWGVILTILILYPIGLYVPGHDHGSFENPWTAWNMLKHSTSIQRMMAIYCGAVFCYNLFAVLVTFRMSSIWHSILDNYRPMTVWITDLFIYYVCTGGSFGEAWTSVSYIQLLGMGVLIYGTAIYNAPDPGSIRLHGQWYSFGIDLSEEYREIQAQRNFSHGSYPSLQHFLQLAGGRESSFRGGNITYGTRSQAMRENGSTPKMMNYASLVRMEQQHSM